MDDLSPQTLPNGERAVAEIEKLRDYCLSPTHLRGRHKARVFQARLGLTADDAEWLQARLLLEAQRSAAQVGKKDGYGQRYVVDFEVTTDVGSATIRSSWIILRDEDVPRLTSCFVR